MATPSPSTAKSGRPLTSFFSAADILPNRPRCPRDAFIRELLEHVVRQNALQGTEGFLSAILDRENANDTVVPSGVAIPHARLDGISQPYIGVATSEEGILFSDTHPPVHLAILVLIPRDQPGLYMQILRALATILRNREAVKTAARLKTADEVMRFFERGGLILPDYVCAADIMRSTFTALRNNDSLKKAIDCFITEQLSEIPVTDRDGDLVGIVSAGALLKVCLPEYQLWMSDLSPIVNFEPFANVLRNEQNTWLSDILLTDFASVQMGAPAVSVAGELTRRKALNCYVLQDKKLMGVIDLPIFLNKVFRE